MAITIQLRGDTAANWTAANPVLAEREMAIETNTALFKIGDGVTAWNDLEYGGIAGADGAPGTTGGANIDGGSPSSVPITESEIDGGIP
jgi:hypothetical protein